MDIRSPIRWIACLVCMFCAGCSTWQHEGESEPPIFKSNRLPPGAVVLEVATVTAKLSQEELEEVVWSVVDDTSIDLDIRRDLWENGFRCSIASSQLPSSLEEMINEKRQEAKLMSAEGIMNNGHSGGMLRLQCRNGKPKQIVMTKDYPQLSWIIDEDGYKKGESREMAQCVFRLRAFPKGDGRVQIDLVPEIHHGQPKPSFDVAAGSYATVMARDKVVFDQFKLSADLVLGRTLVVSCTPDALGLGSRFFTEPETKNSESKILLIRLAQNQIDDLFAPDQILSPIATPTD